MLRKSDYRSKLILDLKIKYYNYFFLLLRCAIINLHSEEEFAKRYRKEEEYTHVCGCSDLLSLNVICGHINLATHAKVIILSYNCIIENLNLRYGLQHSLSRTYGWLRRTKGRIGENRRDIFLSRTVTKIN